MPFKHLNNDAEIPVPCQGCGHKFVKTVGEIRDEPEFTCPKCGLRHDADALAATLKRLDDTMDDL
jgi:predicted nucleic acid-binding Zn ribbon protein